MKIKNPATNLASQNLCSFYLEKIQLQKNKQKNKI